MPKPGQISPEAVNDCDATLALTLTYQIDWDDANLTYLDILV